MDAYLVIARCGMDDVPVRLCATWAEAERWARATSYEQVQALAVDVLGVDVSHVIGVDVIEFDGGRPLERTAVKSFE